MTLHDRIDVLLVDDGQGCLDVLDAVFAELGQVLVRAVGAADALALVRSHDYALILVHIAEPGAHGFDAARAIHANRRSSHTPMILMLPAAGMPAAAEEAYACGAVDVLAMPPAPAVLKAKAGFFIEAFRTAVRHRRSEDALRDTRLRLDDTLAEAARLRRSEERYRTLFESVDDGVCIIEMLFDAKGNPCDYRFLEANPAFVKHTGLTDAIGKTILEQVPGHEAHWFDIYGKVATTGQPTRFVDEARALNRWYDVYATRVGGERSRTVAILFTDISERMLADRELRRLAADLSEANRRKTEFLATLAHELRNPLAPLRSGLQVMRMAGAEPATMARVQDVMDRQLNHMVELVDDLLDISRITRGQVELKWTQVDLREVLAAAVETSTPLIEAGRHRLELDLPSAPLTMVADATRLTQVVSNLLNNAAKYTPRGGRIALTARRSGAGVVLEVSDNGIGIEHDALQAVFDMFTQVGRDTAQTQGGLGIGLSLVRSLVELHGGSVSAASRGADQGSSFTVRLPLGQPPDAAPPLPDLPRVSATAPAIERDAGGLRILVVDDNRDAADTLSALLELLGHDTLVANDGRQALALAPGFAPQVIFLDIGMPLMNGYEVARAMRAEPRFDQALLVALTGWGGEQDRARTSEAGFDLHLTKPVNLSAVERLLAERAA